MVMMMVMMMMMMSIVDDGDDDDGDDDNYGYLWDDDALSQGWRNFGQPHGQNPDHGICVLSIFPDTN